MIDFDVETTNLQHHGADSCDMFMAQFGASSPEAPGVSVFRNPDQQQEIAHWLGLMDEEGFRAHNSKFDLHVLRQAGYTLPDDKLWHDNMVAAHIIDERTSVALQARADKLFGDEAHPEYDKQLQDWRHAEDRRRRKASKETGEKFVPAHYGDVPDDIIEPYAANDIIQTRNMGDLYYPQIASNPAFQQLYDFEMDVMRALFWMEDRGIPFDREALACMEAELLPQLEEIEDRCIDLAGYKGFNPGSWQQISDTLDRLDDAVTKFMTRRSNGYLVTDEENLAFCDHPLAQEILAFRGEKKQLGMLTRILHGKPSDQKFPYAYLTGEDRVHPNFRQVGARTGRMSCANPNFQQIPRDDLRMRYAVKANAGKKLVCCDLDGIEWRLLAAFAGDGAIKDGVLAGEDPHDMTAERVSLRGRKRSTGEMESPRDQGKRLNYLIIFGGGKKAIRKWFHVDQAESGDIYDRMHRAYPEIGGFQARIDATLGERGYLESPLTKRRYRMYGSGYRAVDKEGYKFLNYIIQGTAADILKQAVVKCHKAGLPIIAAVHDEIIAEVDEADAEEAAHTIQEALTTDIDVITDKVPVTADAQIVDRWSEAKKPEYVPTYAQEA